MLYRKQLNHGLGSLLSSVAHEVFLNDRDMPSESNRQKDRWDKLQIAAQVSTAIMTLVFTVVSLVFTVVFSWSQKKNADATLQLARSNFELVKSQVKVSLLPSLSSEDARQRTMALFLAEALDKEFAAEVAGAIAAGDANEGVSERARAMLGSLAQSERDEVRQKAEKGANQYDLMNELRARGLLKKLHEARGYIEGGSPNWDEEALNLYHEVLNQLPGGALEKLDRGLLIDATEDEKSGYKDLAARKYRALFQDYGG